MRYEVINYYKIRGFDIPDIIEKGKKLQWRLSKKQTESACEYVYLQIGQGRQIEDQDLGRYTLQTAKKIRIGNYYRVNLGDPVLLDDLTAIKTLESNLLEANTALVRTKDKLFLWSLASASLFTLLCSILLQIKWY